MINEACQISMQRKHADIVAFEKDMFELTPEEILEDKVVMTMFDGRIAYKCD